MSLILACKAFIKALRDPKGAQLFLDGNILNHSINKSQNRSQLESSDQSHLRLLSLLQHSGRLIDFLKEDISSFDDAQIGAVVRKIHEDCSKSLEEMVTIRPIMDENEGTKITIQQGYDPSRIKVVGKVNGEPPFNGILVHRGWKAHKRSLPKKLGEQASEVICPAEVEVR